MNTAFDISLLTTPDYRKFIVDLKTRVAAAHLSASRAVNREVVLLYWDIGRGIVEEQQLHGWGESVVEMVAADLRREFPQISGFSARNVWDMRRLFETYPGSEISSRSEREIGHGRKTPILRQPVAELTDGEKRSQLSRKLNEVEPIAFLRQLVAEIPWGHNLLNDKERGPDDQPSIGIILCAEKDDVEVEYALRTKSNPIGVAAYQLQSKLPGELKGKLPTAKQLAGIVRSEMDSEK